MATDMSSDELRAHLYRSLQGKGVLDSLKSQLRNRLARELQNTMEGKESDCTLSAPPSRGQSSMMTQVVNNMVAEYLQKAGYEFTLSIFLPEAGVNIGKLFTSEDLMRFMNIPPSSPLHNTLQSPNEQGFLVQLVEGLATLDVSHVSPRECTAVQTDEREQRPTPSVAAKLQALDESYAYKAEEETRRSQEALEERMAAFQRECQGQHRRQLEAEMAHFRERELAKMREEERERCEGEMRRVREELLGAHRQKLEAVRKMEVETLQRLRRKEQELEAGVYSQRQSLLEELEVLRMRERELKRQGELNKQAASLEEERVKSLVEQLAGKERALEEMRKQYEHAAEERVRKYTLECDAALQSKRSELMRWETELRASQQQVSHVHSEFQRLAVELKEERGKTERLQGLLHEATSHQITLQHQKDAMQQKVDQMNDYPHLRQRASDLQQQLLAAERKLSEAKTEHRRRSSELQQMVKQLQTHQALPSPELCTLQSELEQMRKTHHKEMLVMEYDNKQLGRQLAVQSESCLRLQQQLDKRTVQLMSTQREVEDLQSQLELLHTALVAGGRERRERVGAKGAGTEGKRPPLQPKKTTSTRPKLTAAPPLSTTTITHPPPYKSPTPYTESLSTPLSSHDVSFSDASWQFLAETRATFARLEKEAEELEKSYKDFQQRITPGVSSSILHEPTTDFPLLENDAVFQRRITGGVATPLDVDVTSEKGEVSVQATETPFIMAAPYASWPVSHQASSPSLSHEGAYRGLQPSTTLHTPPVLHHTSALLSPTISLTTPSKLQLTSTHLITGLTPERSIQPQAAAALKVTNPLQLPSITSSPTRLLHTHAHTQLTSATNTLISTREISSTVPLKLLPATVPMSKLSETATGFYFAYPSITSKPQVAATAFPFTVSAQSLLLSSQTKAHVTPAEPVPKASLTAHVESAELVPKTSLTAHVEPAELVPKASLTAHVEPAELVPKASLTAHVEPAELVPKASLTAHVTPAELVPKASLTAHVTPAKLVPKASLTAHVEPAELVPKTSLTAHITPAELVPKASLTAHVEPAEPVPKASLTAHVTPAELVPKASLTAHVEPAELVPKSSLTAHVEPAELVPKASLTAHVTPAELVPKASLTAHVEPAELVPKASLTAHVEPAELVPKASLTAHVTPAELVPKASLTAHVEPAELVPKASLTAHVEPAELVPKASLTAHVEPAELVPKPSLTAHVTPAELVPKASLTAHVEPAELVPKASLTAHVEPAELVPKASLTAHVTPAELVPKASLTTHVEPAELVPKTSLTAHVTPAEPVPKASLTAHVESAELVPKTSLTAHVEPAELVPKASLTAHVEPAELVPKASLTAHVEPAELVPKASLTAHVEPAELVPKTSLTAYVTPAELVPKASLTAHVEPAELVPKASLTAHVTPAELVPKASLTAQAKPTPKLSLDDLWKSSSGFLQTNTARETGGDSRTYTPATSMESSWEAIQEQRVEEREKREQEKEERNQRDPDMHKRTDHKTENTPSGEKGEESSLGTQLELEGDAIVKRKEERRKEEEEGIDPVMLKYMELVTQRRKQQKIQDHSSREEQKLSLGHDEQEPLSANSNGRDYGLPSMSQESDKSFGGYSDKTDDLFEDW